MSRFYKKFYLLALMILSVSIAYSSDTLRGKIENEAGKRIPSVKVILANKFTAISTPNGEFRILYSGTLQVPLEIKIESNQYQIKEYVYLEDEEFVEITVNPVAPKEVAQEETPPTMPQAPKAPSNPEILTTPAIDMDSLSFQVYKEDLKNLVEDMQEERTRIEESNRVIHEEIVRITDRLANDSSLTDSQRKELETYVVTLEKTVHDNNEAFVKAQAHTTSLINKLKSIITKKELQIAQIEKEKKMVERRLNRNVIIFSIVSFSLLLLAMVFYNIAYKMKKQKAASEKLRKLINRFSEDVRIPLMNIEKLSTEAIHKQQQNDLPSKELGDIKETVGKISSQFTEFLEETVKDGGGHKQNHT